MNASWQYYTSGLQLKDILNPSFKAEWFYKRNATGKYDGWTA